MIIRMERSNLIWDKSKEIEKTCQSDWINLDSINFEVGEENNRVDREESAWWFKFTFQVSLIHLHEHSSRMFVISIPEIVLLIAYICSSPQIGYWSIRHSCIHCVPNLSNMSWESFECSTLYLINEWRKNAQMWLEGFSMYSRLKDNTKIGTE